ncbi:MAG: hypothetical protein II036_01580, partial [Oscillospiraceae bacterium]|nr:hypothetical protein [Oscillospiraceae bacterium]
RLPLMVSCPHSSTGASQLNRILLTASSFLETVEQKGRSIFYENIEEFLSLHGDKDLWLTTTKAPRQYTEADLSGEPWILFGKETAGLPLWLRERYRDRCVRLPMREDARSLNLSNTAAVMCYEALRQQGFPGLSGTGEMAAK